MARLRGSSRRRDQIITATVTCIIKHGYHNFSMQDVALTAGVSKGIIHYYFLNKDELMMAVLDKCSVDIESMLLEKMRSVDDPLRKIEIFVAICFDVLRSKKEYYQVNMDFWTQINQKEAVREVIARHYEKFRETAARVISEGITVGVFKEVDARMYASYVISVVDGFSLQSLFDESLFDYDQMTEMAKQMIVDGLSKR